MKIQLHTAGLVERAKRRGAHRRKRERKPCEGMMLHQDGSKHVWLEGLAELDLIVSMDDATSKVYSAFLVEEEGTASSFRGLREVIDKHGLFCELYTDRSGHYFYTPKAGEPVSKSVATQVGRALSQLGISHIAAYSPQARGRSERAFGTLQDRLPKELRLAGITTLEVANQWIAHTYIAAHNAAFAVSPEQEGSAFVLEHAGLAADILCVHSGGAPGRQRQHRQMARAQPADPTQPRAGAFRARHGAISRISRRRPRRVPRPALPGPLHWRWHAARDQSSGGMSMRSLPTRTCPSLTPCSRPSRTLRAAARSPMAILDRRCARRLSRDRSGRRDGLPVEQRDGFGVTPLHSSGQTMNERTIDALRTPDNLTSSATSSAVSGGCAGSRLT